MNAMIITAFGGPEVFSRRTDWPIPSPGPNELLVKLHAVSINPVDYKIRANGKWANLEPPTIIGYDGCGVVTAVGSAVTKFVVGDEVFYSSEIFGKQGCYAEYHTVNQNIVAKKPSNLSFEEAACVPLAAGTAYEGLVRQVKLQVGETILIHGSTGGVGHYVIQIAKAIGAVVLATASTKNLDLAKKLGADFVIDYKTQSFVDEVNQITKGAGVDVVFDCVGGDMLAKSVPIIKRHGRMATIAGTSHALDALYKAVHVIYVWDDRDGQKVEALRLMVERGQIKPIVDIVLPITEIAAAHKRLEAGGVRGKIALTVKF